MNTYSTAVTHSHSEDRGQATMRLEYEKALERVLPCRCLAAVYHACFWFAAAFLPPLTFLLQVRLWLDPSITCPMVPPSSEAAHVCVSPTGQDYPYSLNSC